MLAGFILVCVFLVVWGARGDDRPLGFKPEDHLVLGQPFEGLRVRVVWPDGARRGRCGLVAVNLRGSRSPRHCARAFESVEALIDYIARLRLVQPDADIVGVVLRDLEVGLAA